MDFDLLLTRGVYKDLIRTQEAKGANKAKEATEAKGADKAREAKEA